MRLISQRTFFFLLLPFILLLGSGCDLTTSIVEDVGLFESATEEPLLPTAEPTEESESDSAEAAVEELIPYLSIEHGVAFRYPTSWVVREDPFLALATDPALFSGTQGENSGALLSIVPAPSDIQLNESLVDGLTQFLDRQDAFQVLIQPQPLNWGGQEATFARGVGVDEEGLEFVVLFALVRNQGSTLFISGVTPDHIRYEATLRNIMESIIVSQAETSRSVPIEEEELIENLVNYVEPSEDQSSVIAAQSGPISYRDPEGRFQLRLPTGWQVDDNDPGAILLASEPVLLGSNEIDTGAVIWIFPQTVDVESLGVPADVLIIELLNQFVANFGIYDGLDLVLPPAPTSIGDLPAATAQYDATFQSFPILVDYYAVLNGDQVLFFVSLIASGSAAEQKPVTDRLIESTQFLQ